MRSLAIKIYKNQIKIAGERFELSTSGTLPRKMIKYHFPRGSRALSCYKNIQKPNKNSWGEIRTLDLTGMSRALSPTELPSQGFSSLFNYQPAQLLRALLSQFINLVRFAHGSYPAKVYSLFSCHMPQLLQHLSELTAFILAQKFFNFKHFLFNKFLLYN